MAGILDSNLVDEIDSLPAATFDGSIWRVTWSTRDPLAGNFAGGRWSPSGRFEALYASLVADGALAEIYHHLSRAPVFSSSHMLINRLTVKLDSVLDLDAKTLKTLGVDEATDKKNVIDLCQSIGKAAYMIDYQGLLVPSVRWDCSNLVIFMDRIDLNLQIQLHESEDVNWPAWRERRK